MGIESASPWISLKENVKPTMEKAITENGNETRKLISKDYAIELKQREFEELLAQDLTSADPLAIWQSYINWLLEAFPDDTKQTRLLSAYEKCAKRFQYDERYKDDGRYVRIWILYADSVRDAGDLLQFMFSRDIGTKRTVFYLAWAMYLEAKGNLKQAAEVFEMGIARKARPLEKLKALYSAFQKRSLSGLAQDISSGPSSVPPDACASVTVVDRAVQRGQAVKEDQKAVRPRVQGKQSGVGESLRVAKTTVAGPRPNERFVGLAEMFQTNAISIEEIRAQHEKYAYFKPSLPVDCTIPGSPQSMDISSISNDFSSPPRETNISPVAVQKSVDLIKPITSDKFQNKENSVGVSNVMGHAVQPNVDMPRGEASEDLTGRLKKHMTFDDLSLYQQTPTASLKPSKAPRFCDFGIIQEKSVSASQSKKVMTQSRSSTESSAIADNEAKLDDYLTAMVDADPTVTARTTGKILGALDDIFDSSRPLAGETYSDDEYEALDCQDNDRLSKDGLARAKIETAFSENASVDRERPEPDQGLGRPVSKLDAFRGGYMSPLSSREAAQPEEDDMEPIQVYEEVTATATLTAHVARTVGLDPAEYDQENIPSTTEPVFVSPLEFLRVGEKNELSPIHETERENCSSDHNPSIMASQAEHQHGHHGQVVQVSPTSSQAAEIWARNQQELSQLLEDTQAYTVHTSSYPILSRRLHKNDFIQLDDYELAVEGPMPSSSTCYCYEVVNAVDADEGDGHFTLKVSSQPCPWEFYIIKVYQERLTALALGPYVGQLGPMLVTEAYKCAVYGNCCATVADFPDNGTVQDLLDLGLSRRGAVQEPLVAFLAIGLLQVVELLRGCHLVHTNIISENVYLRMSLEDEDSINAPWSSDGDGGWANWGVQLAGMESALDCALYPDGVKFIGQPRAEQSQAMAKRLGHPWCYEIDSLAILDIVHQLLFNEPLVLTWDAVGQWTVPADFSRLAASSTWADMFDILGNDDGLSNLCLVSVRERLEAYLSSSNESRQIKARLLALQS